MNTTQKLAQQRIRGVVDHDKTKPAMVRSTIRYADGTLQPEDFRRFIQLGSFEKDWARLGLDDDDLRALEVLIMMGPDLHPVVPGTGSLRKIRFTSRRWGKGRSKGVRIGYAHFPLSAVVVLIVAYSHNEQDDLSPVQRRTIKDMLRDIEKLLAEGA
jgi:hypothetical protein